VITAGFTMAGAQTSQLPQCSFGRTQNKGVTLERQINLSNPADKISSTLVQRSLASGLSGGTNRKMAFLITLGDVNVSAPIVGPWAISYYCSKQDIFDRPPLAILEPKFI
jgi:hypothetical protein